MYIFSNSFFYSLYNNLIQLLLLCFSKGYSVIFVFNNQFLPNSEISHFNLTMFMGFSLSPLSLSPLSLSSCLTHFPFPFRPSPFLPSPRPNVPFSYFTIFPCHPSPLSLSPLSLSPCPAHLTSPYSRLSQFLCPG